MLQTFNYNYYITGVITIKYTDMYDAGRDGRFKESSQQYTPPGLREYTVGPLDETLKLEFIVLKNVYNQANMKKRNILQSNSHLCSLCSGQDEFIQCSALPR